MSEELEIQVLAKSERFNEKKEALKALVEEIPEQSRFTDCPTRRSYARIYWYGI